MVEQMPGTLYADFGSGFQRIGGNAEIELVDTFDAISQSAQRCADELREANRSITPQMEAIDGTWYELPDHADGEYVLIEQLRTNFYGYYEGQGSERELLTRAAADQVVASVGRGIVKQVAVISVSGEVVQCHRDEVELFRKQGM